MVANLISKYGEAVPCEVFNFVFFNLADCIILISLLPGVQRLSILQMVLIYLNISPLRGMLTGSTNSSRKVPSSVLFYTKTSELRSDNSGGKTRDNTALRHACFIFLWVHWIIQIRVQCTAKNDCLCFVCALSVLCLINSFQHRSARSLSGSGH